MTLKNGIAAAGLLLAVTLTGCGAPSGPGVTGTITAKEYEPAEYKNKRTCVKKVNGKCKTYKTKRTKTDDEEWEVTITDSSGVEHEVEVSRDVYDRVREGQQVTKGGGWPK